MHQCMHTIPVPSTNTVSQEDIDRGETITTTVSLPRELWKRVRMAAVEHETSAQQLCADGLELLLSKLSGEKRKSK